MRLSDGTSLTSADVVYSIGRALQPAEKSPCGPSHLALIKDSDKLLSSKIKTVIGDSVLTPDPNTVVLIANKKASYFLDALTSSCSYTVEKSLVDKYSTSFTDHLIKGGGDDPFMVKSYIHHQEIDFVPNPSISVKAAPTDFNKLIQEITTATNNPHGLQFWEWFWSADYPDPQDWTTLQFDKGAPNNNMNYGQNNSSDAAQQQATQQLLEKADVNPDPTSRLPLIRCNSWPTRS